jgi:hypothetical protein
VFRLIALLSAFLIIALTSSRLAAQVTIDLNTVIGAAGTNAASVDGVGNAVNFTGFAVNSGATTLIAAGSSGSSSFDFNTGFAGGLDRASGSSAGAPNVWVDLKYDSSTTGPLLLDTDNDGAFLDNTPVTGFGMHGDTFITFDLAVIRANNSLAANTAFTLTGSAGVANFSGYGQTSAAIIIDGTQLGVYDWTESGPLNQFSTYNLSISGTARYLTFTGLSGLDGSNWGAHVGFANVQLMAVPEPSVVWLLGTGLAAFGFRRLRRPAKDSGN